MTDPGVSLFQGGGIEIDNPQSKEEDEDLEEHIRRQEELADLLTAGIGAFNYEESTIDSSSTSFEGIQQDAKELDNPLQFKYNESLNKHSVPNGDVTDSILEQNYKDSRPQDQLKILYDVRLREINGLKDDFAKYKAEKEKEIGVLKNKVTLSEAEIQHLQLSATNLESLLVEKTEIISSLKQDMSLKDREIENLKRNEEQLKRDICSYSSMVNELELKLADNNPFGNKSRKSGDLQNSHQDQLIKLETHLQEQTRKVEILEKENVHLKEDIRKLAKAKNEIEEENNETIMALSKKLQVSQQQCRDLFLLGEAIKKESDHFKERMSQMETNKIDISNENFKTKSMDKETMAVHLEKLKRMLLDRDVEINTLQAKLKFYDSDLEELFQYRKLLNNLHNSEIKLCGNLEHGELLLFMQRELQTYQQAVEDRNQQIRNLNTINRELQEKIEEMIQQTRTDIQNLSEKYSLPQLEIMNNELQNAGLKIKQLESELAKKSENIDVEKEVLVTKLEKAQQENEYLLKLSKSEKENFDDMLVFLRKDLKRSEDEISSLKQILEELKNENKKLKSDMIKHHPDISNENSDESVKAKYAEVQDQLQQVAKKLENMNEEKDLYEVIKFVRKLKKKIVNVIAGLQSPDVNVKKEDILDILTEWHKSLINFLESANLNSSSLFKLRGNETESKDSVHELINTKTLLEGENFALEQKIKDLTKELQETKNELLFSKESNNKLTKEIENTSRLIKRLDEDLKKSKELLDATEKKKAELVIELEKAEKQSTDSKLLIIQLQKQIGEINENVIKKTLFKELKDVEKILERSRSENDVSGTDLFQKCLQDELIKAELLLRDKLQEESLKRIANIEEQYKKIITENIDSFAKEKVKWKNQEASWKKQFAAVLEECSKKMLELENENVRLIEQTDCVIKEYQEYKKRVFSAIAKYQSVIVELRNEKDNLRRKWEDILHFSISNYSLLTKQSIKKSRIIKKINSSQSQIELIQKAYDEKIKKFKQNGMLPTKE